MPQCLWHILYQTRSPGAIGWRWVDIKISTLEKALLAVTAAFLLLAAGYFLGARSGTVVESCVNRVGVNINTASAEELDTLPGIGAQRAADIIADREANGPFRIPEDLTRVPGIGEGILEGLMDYITVE